MRNIMTVFIVLLLIIAAGLTYTRRQSRASKGDGKEEHMKINLEDFKTGTIKVYRVQEGRFVEVPKVYKPADQWREVLSKMEFNVAFEAGTERPFTGELNANKKSGVYRSKVSGNDLFHSAHKFDSGTGWPSFYRPVDEKNVILREDKSLFMKRVEVVDAVSGAHLGHVFEDGPPPTGLRYCINSAALEFVEGVAFKEPPQED